jgi:hypothetical protein
MVLLEISQVDLQRVETTLFAEIAPPNTKCDSCRHLLAFKIFRIGSGSEKLQSVKRLTNMLKVVTKRVEIRLDSRTMTALYDEQHVKVFALCPYCSEQQEIEIFLQEA